jgi:predicted nucleic acid-binding protein
VAEVVSNTSPLIYLHRLGRLDLLPRMFGKVLVPVQVMQEIDRGRALGHDVPEIEAQPWVDVRKAPFEHDYPALGAGERGVLDVARGLRAAVVLLDDGAARVWAARLSLPCIGVVGLLVEARRLGHLERVAPELDRLVRLGFRMDAALRQRALAECGEG